MGMTKDELLLLDGCLDALIRKCKTYGLYQPAKRAKDVIERELRMKHLEATIPKMDDSDAQNRI